MAKNIVICFDGTGNEFGKNNTNVVDTVAAVTRDQDQKPYYDTGVGTFNPLGVSLGAVSKKLGIMMGQAFGYGVKQNVREAYEFIMENYEPDDKVFIFGFSRGAYTARVLAGLLCKCGLLLKGSKNLIPSIMKMNFGNTSHEVIEGFKDSFCHHCAPHFVGVWDTVASVGHFHPTRGFKDGTLHPNVKYGFHAVAIDEQRKKFPVNLWDESNIPEDQTIEQVWFAGVHSDVGGWYDERGLSNIALRWMLENAQDCGLRLKDEWDKGLVCNPNAPIHNSRSGFWKVWGPVTRPIPEGATVHESVEIRKAALEEYNPVLPQTYKVAADAARTLVANDEPDLKPLTIDRKAS